MGDGEMGMVTLVLNTDNGLERLTFHMVSDDAAREFVQRIHVSSGESIGDQGLFGAVTVSTARIVAAFAHQPGETPCTLGL